MPRGADLRGLLLVSLLTGGLLAGPALPASGDLTIERLPNGALLATAPSGHRFYVKEDHSVPMVVLDTWMRVGARDELGPEEGMAHFFEHITFDGTTSRSKEDLSRFFFKHAAGKNAGTRYDLTDYYLEGPVEHFATFAEVHADMLMHPAVTEEEFQREREVVKEELRQAYDNPASWLYRQMVSEVLPHTNYDHWVLGSMDSLNGMSAETMRAFHKTQYIPANAFTIVIGDIDAHTALETMRRAFASWTAAPPRPAPALVKPEQRAPRTFAIAGDFETPTVMLGFPAPAFEEPTSYALDLLMMILGDGKASRLTRTLRDELGLVGNVNASNTSMIEASLLNLTWTPLEDAAIETSTYALLDELARIRQEGPTLEELARAKRTLAINQVFEDETLLGQARGLGFAACGIGFQFHDEYLERIYGVTAQDVQWAAQTYLRSDQATLGIIGPEGTSELAPDWARLDVPFAQVLKPSDLGRKGQDPLASTAEATGATDTPAPSAITLRNGLAVHLLPSRANSTVAATLAVRGGLGWEQWANNGIGSLMARMLTKGTTTRSVEEIATLQDELGGGLSAAAGRDFFSVSGLFLATDAERGLALLADVVQHPTFPADELEPVRLQQLQAIAQQQDNLQQLTLEQLRHAAYGPDHPYGRPYNGRSGVVETLQAADLAAFHQQVFAPNHAVLVIAGDFDPTAMEAMVTAQFGSWPLLPAVSTMVQPDELPDPTPAEGIARILSVKDKAQSFIWLGVPGLGLTDPDLPALDVMNTVLGSSSQSRLFMQLRGEEGLAYSTYSTLFTGRGTGLFLAYIATRPEMYEQAVTGLRREIARIASEGPTEEEVLDAITYSAGAEIRAHQGHLAKATYAAANLARGLPIDYEWQQLAARETMTRDLVQSAAEQYLDLTNHWLVAVGPLYQEPADLN